jgi:AcrR family transcriptional regulator
MNKERIKRKADELFRLYGIRSVTMDAISAQLGISKKTLYQSFKDKSALVDEVIKDILNQTVKSSSRCKKMAENAVHEFFVGLEAMDEIIAAVNPTILFDLEKGYPKSYKRFQNFKDEYLFNLIYDNIVWGKKDELYRKEIDEDIYARVRLEMIIMSFNEQLFPRTRYNFLQIQKESLFLFLYSLVTPKGLKLLQKYLKTSIKK